MKFLFCALILGLVVATQNDKKEIKLTGNAYTGSDLTTWLNDCTQSVQTAGCSQCTCKEAKFHDEVVITVHGAAKDLDKLEDHIEDNGITIYQEAYAFVGEEEEDGTVTLVVTLAIFFLMCFCIIGFFACMPWPNTPAKKAERAAKRRQEEADKKAAEKTKSALSGSTSRANLY